MNTIKKISWEEIKHQVNLVNPTLFAVIESLNISPHIPFFLANYQFGAHFGIKNHAYLPLPSGQLERIDSAQMENELLRHLGYGKHSLPLGLILDKYCEWHVIGKEGRLFPDCIQGPGAIFNMQVIFDEAQTIDNNVLSVSSGALSSFLLPNIGCQRQHNRLQKYFGVSHPAPKNPYEHYLIFQDLLSHKMASTDWTSQILYFSEAFINEVKHNEQWLKLKLFFSESLRKKLTTNTYDASCHDLFLSTQQVNRFRPTPFILDTAKYIFNIGMGSGIGVKPAINEDHLPVKTIQKIYHECYGLEYIPTVMVPTTLHTTKEPVYYPLQCPFAKINTFKTNQSNSTLKELATLKDVLLTYQQEFTQEHGDAYGSPLYQVSKNTTFSFYHYQSEDDDQKGLIKNSQALLSADERFTFSYCHDQNLNFSRDAKLFRGLVQLSTNNLS